MDDCYRQFFRAIMWRAIEDAGEGCDQAMDWLNGTSNTAAISCAELARLLGFANTRPVLDVRLFGRPGVGTPRQRPEYRRPVGVRS